MNRIAFILAMILAVALPDIAAADDEVLLRHYEKVSMALVEDDLDAAKQSAAELTKIAAAAGNGKIADASAKLAQVESLEAARDHFKPISGEAVKLAEGRDNWHVATCPMAGSDWVQSGREIANPFMGQSMPTCGMLKRKS